MPNIAKDIFQKSATFICQIALELYSKEFLLYMYIQKSAK